MGVPEARRLLRQALRQAEAATRQELLESLTASTGMGAAAASSQLEHEGLVRALQEVGLSAAAAERLAAACEAAGGRLATADGAAAKLSQLRRLLPGVNVVAMVQRDARALTQTDAALAVRNLTTLAVAMPAIDPASLCAAYPPLLWYEDDLEGKLRVALAMLRKWSPKSDAQQIVEAHPHLIDRIARFYVGAEFFQLPLELQNAMAVGGGGGGTHYRSWGGFEDNNTD